MRVLPGFVLLQLPSLFSYIRNDYDFDHLGVLPNINKKCRRDFQGICRPVFCVEIIEKGKEACFVKIILLSLLE